MQGQGEESKRWEQREAPTVCLGRLLSCAVKNEEGDREHTRRGEAGSQALLEASVLGSQTLFQPCPSAWVSSTCLQS